MKQFEGHRRSMMRSLLVLIPTTMLLVGCATAHFDTRACPPLKSYSRDEQLRLKKELETAGPMIRQASVDYLKLRDFVRACRSAGR